MTIVLEIEWLGQEISCQVALQSFASICTLTQCEKVHFTAPAMRKYIYFRLRGWGKELGFFLDIICVSQLIFTDAPCI